MKYKIILASNSPRRRELLAGADIDFIVDTRNNFVEGPEAGVDPHQVPLDMSIGKSHGFHRPLAQDELLITADTVVAPNPRSMLLHLLLSCSESRVMRMMQPVCCVC